MTFAWNKIIFVLVPSRCGLEPARGNNVAVMVVSLHEATLAAYKATSFDAVPASYVEDAWESNFCESVSLPSSELEDALLDVLAWRGVVENTREWSRAGSQEEQLAAAQGE